MTSDDDLTAADAELLAALASEGRSVSAWQTKRWRKNGVLVTTRRRSAGRGAGRPSLGYPPEARRQAETIADLVDAGVTLKEMPVAMVVRGVAPPSIEIVRRSYLHLIQEVGGSEDDRIDAADAVLQHLLRRARRIPVLRHWSRHARTIEGKKRGALGDALTHLVELGGTTDLEPGPEGVHAVATALRVPDWRARFVIGLVKVLMPQLLRRYAHHVTMEELLRAREEVWNIFRHAPRGDQPPDFEAAGLIILALAAVECYGLKTVVATQLGLELSLPGESSKPLN